MSDKKLIRLSRHPENFGQTPDELEKGMFESGLPTQHTHTYYEDKELGLYIGVWDTTEMVETAGPYVCDEFMVLLEGTVTIKNVKTGLQEQVNAGETFIIPKGYDCQWIQTGYCRKFFVIYENPDEVMPEKPTFEGVFEGIVKLKDTTEASNIEVKMTGDDFVMEAGKTVPKGLHCYKNHSGKFFSGIWKSEKFETKRQSFPRNEFIYIHSGSLICIDENNQAHSFNSGDALFIPQGTICHWQVVESVCTFYAVLQ